MPYSTKADIQKEISDEQLIALTDDAGSGQMDDAKITAAIAKADGIIDSYCGQVATVPLTTVHDVIKEHSITIAIYFLFSRRSAVPEIRRKNYEDAIAHLKDISTGKASLPPVGASEVPGGDETEISSADRIFTRDKMKGF